MPKDKPKSVFQEAKWEIAAIVISIIGIFVSIGIYILENDQKALEINIIESNLIFNLDAPLPDGFEAFYKKEAVSSLAIFNVKIENSGSSSILDNDFTRPLRLMASPNGKIIDVKIINSSPTGIGLDLKFNDDTIEFTPTLLNSDDFVVIEVFVINLPKSLIQDPFKADGRIVGVQSLVVTNLTVKKSWVDLVVGLALDTTAKIFISIGFLVLITYFGIRTYKRVVVFKPAKRQAISSREKTKIQP